MMIGRMAVAATARREARSRVRWIAASAATVLLASCEGSPASAPPATPPSVVALARSSTDASSAELAAGIAVEVGNRLASSALVVMPSVVAPLAEAGAAFAETSERLAVDVVIWVDVSSTADGPAVSYEIETAEGSLRADRTLVLDESGLRSAANRIVVDALSLVTDEALRGAPHSSWELAAPASDYEQLLRTLGRAYAGAGEAERVALYEALPPTLSSYPPAAVELGHAYLDLAGTQPGTGPYYQRAEETLRRAFQLDPAYPPARYLLASCLTKLGRSEEAVALLLEGLASQPTYAPYHDQLGYVARYAGLMDLSMASYRRAQELDASLENLVSTQDQITKSLIYLGRYAEALASHDRMEGFLARLGSTPDEKEWFYRGVIHLYAGELESALEAFRRGEETDAATIWTQFGRGYAGIAGNDTARVAEVLDALEKSVVVDGERHYRLVHLAAFLGEPEGAIGHLETSIRSGFFAAPYFASDPLTQAIRGHPDFAPALGDAELRHRAFRAQIEKGAGAGAAEP